MPSNSSAGIHQPRGFVNLPRVPSSATDPAVASPGSSRYRRASSARSRTTTNRLVRSASNTTPALPGGWIRVSSLCTTPRAKALAITIHSEVRRATTTTAIVSRTTKVSVYGSSRRLGANSTPLNPASPAPTAQAPAETRLTLMTLNSASSRSSTTARASRPTLIRISRAMITPTTTTTAMSAAVLTRTVTSPGSCSGRVARAMARRCEPRAPR